MYHIHIINCTIYNILAKYAGRQKVIFIYCTWIIELKSKSVFHRNIRHVIHIVFLGHSVFLKIWKYLIHCVFFGKVENIWYTVFCRQVKHIWNTLYLRENSWLLIQYFLYSWLFWYSLYFWDKKLSKLNFQRKQGLL